DPPPFRHDGATKRCDGVASPASCECVQQDAPVDDTSQERHMKKLALISAVLAASVATISPALAESDQQQAVNEAATVIEHIRSGHEDLAVQARSLMGRSRAVMVIPELVKGGFFFGAQGGSGVLVARAGAHDWTDPAFYSMGAASFGLQIGVEVSKVV